MKPLRYSVHVWPTTGVHVCVCVCVHVCFLCVVAIYYQDANLILLISILY